MSNDEGGVTPSPLPPGPSPAYPPPAPGYPPAGTAGYPPPGFAYQPPPPGYQNPSAVPYWVTPEPCGPETGCHPATAAGFILALQRRHRGHPSQPQDHTQPYRHRRHRQSAPDLRNPGGTGDGSPDGCGVLRQEHRRLVRRSVRPRLHRGPADRCRGHLPGHHHLERNADRHHRPIRLR